MTCSTFARPRRQLPESIEVRLAEVADGPELARLNQAFNGVVEPPEELAARLVDPRRVDYPLLALAGGRAVGFASLRLAPCVFYPEPYAELAELYVEPGWRRRGVGKALVSMAESLARQAGAAEIVLLTGPGNLGGQAFYRAMGYRLADLEMVKDLNG